MLVTFLMCLMVIQTQDDSYVLWLKNNKRMEIKAPPECNGPRCVVTLLNGDKTTLPSNIVDLERSQAFNKELDAKRLAAREEASRIYREVKALEAKEEERKKQKRIVLTNDVKLPAYDRSKDQVVDPEQPVPEAAAAENTDTAPPAAAEDASETNEDSSQTGETSQLFSSSGAIYVAKETITPRMSDYGLTCLVHMNLDKITEFKLDVSVFFVDNPQPFTISKSVNGAWSKDQEVSVDFTIPGSDKILRIAYDLQAKQGSASK